MKNSKILNNVQNNENTPQKNAIINPKLNIFQMMTKALIFDEYNIKNSLMFQLYLNKDKKGMSSNELYNVYDHLLIKIF